MRRIFKKAFLLLCLILMPVQSVSVFAENDVRLYEKYEYSEKFQYSDEIIAHALKSTVPQIRMSYSARVRYKPVKFNEDYVIELVSEIYAGYNGNVSVESILEVMQTDMNENIADYLTFDTQKEVETSGVFTGSGVVIDEEGLIATNSHVISLSEDAKKQLYYYGLQEEINEDMVNIVQKLGEFGVSFSEDELNEFYLMVLGAAIENLQILNDDVRLEVWFPTADGATSADSAKIYEAEVIAEGTQGGIEGLTQDTAILKINAQNLVALKLSEGYPELNSKIVSAGFPAAADTPFLGLGSEESTLSITVGNGSVARLIPIEGTEYQAIGITSTLSGGSSGGPSVDAGLAIEGLNTYINSEDERYGYMIPAEMVLSLLDGNKSGQGELSKTFLTGLQLLQNDYGPAAKECFESVAAQQPDTPYILNLITLAENAPQNEFVGSNTGIRKFLPIILVAVAVLLVLVIIIVVIASRKKHKTTYTIGRAETVPLCPGGAPPREDFGRTAPLAAVEATVPLVTYTPPGSASGGATAPMPPAGGRPVAAAPSYASERSAVHNPNVAPEHYGMSNPAVAPQRMADHGAARTAPTGPATSALRSTMPARPHSAEDHNAKSSAPSTHSAFGRPSDSDL